jgi:hypothetical protein
LSGRAPSSATTPLSGRAPLSTGVGGTSIGVPASIGAEGQVPRCALGGRLMLDVGLAQVAQISARAGYESATPA